LLVPMAATGCLTNTQTNLAYPWQGAQARMRQESQPALVYTFRATTWQETTLAGIPFYVRSRTKDENQGFLLCMRQGQKYLPNIACGYLDQDGIVWTNWVLENPTTKSGQTLTFELWTRGQDKVGITEVSLLADNMFIWQGDDLKNPPK